MTMNCDKKIIVCLLLGVFIVASFPPVLAQEWGTLEDEYFIVKYPLGYEDDANKILEYANFALQVVMEKYPHELSQKVVICLYDYSNYNDPPYVTRYDSGKREISLLAPSDQPAQYRSYCDDLWYQKNIIHEYVHVPFYQDLGYGNVPGWFSQGLAEYFSIFCSTPSILIKYESHKIEDMVKNGEGYLMSVGGDEYYGGAYIVKYMYEVYGQDNVTNLIKSDAVSFIPALEKELNVTPREFEDKWLKWACEEFGADYDLYAISETVPTVEIDPGEPEIVEVSDITIAGGEQATFTAKVKNVGYTEDTFIPHLDLPRGMTVISYPGDASIPVDETVTLTWVLSVGDVETARTETATLRVVAKNSLLEDSVTFPVHLEPNPGPPIRMGDLTVYVLDETNAPIAGAEVTCAGVNAVTGADGIVVINDIREGNQQLSVSFEGYTDHSETISIREGTNSRTVRLSKGQDSTDQGFPLALLAIALGIGIPVVLGGVILIGKKKGWWLR